MREKIGMNSKRAVNSAIKNSHTVSEVQKAVHKLQKELDELRRKDARMMFSDELKKKVDHNQKKRLLFLRLTVIIAIASAIGIFPFIEALWTLYVGLALLVTIPGWLICRKKKRHYQMLLDGVEKVELK